MILQWILKILFVTLLASACFAQNDQEPADFSNFLGPESPASAPAAAAAPVKELKAKKSETQGTYCIICHHRGNRHRNTNLQDIGDVKQNIESNYTAPSTSSVASASTTSSGQDPYKRFPELLKYSNSSQVKNMIGYAIHHKNPRDLLRCLHYVKEALLNGGHLISHWFNSNASFPSKVHGMRGVGEDLPAVLKKEKFVNLLEDPRYRDFPWTAENAPKGAVMISEGGHWNAGHPEIKTDFGKKGGFVSNFYDHRDVETVDRQNHHYKRHQLVAIMVKVTED